MQRLEIIRAKQPIDPKNGRTDVAGNRDIRQITKDTLSALQLTSAQDSYDCCIKLHLENCPLAPHTAAAVHEQMAPSQHKLHDDIRHDEPKRFWRAIQNKNMPLAKIHVLVHRAPMHEGTRSRRWQLPERAVCNHPMNVAAGQPSYSKLA